MNIEDTHMLSGQQLIRNYYINEWPNKARPGFLEPIFADASYDTDISIHLIREIGRLQNARSKATWGHPRGIRTDERPGSET